MCVCVVYVCVSRCVRTRVCTFGCACVHMHRCTLVNAYVCARVSVNMRVYVVIARAEGAYVSMCVCMHGCTLVCVCVCLYRCTCVYVCDCVCLCVYARVYVSMCDVCTGVR